MSKGSRPRPFAVSNEEYQNRWDAIFGRDNEEKNKTQDLGAARPDVTISTTATFSGGKDDSSPSCCCLSVMTNTDDEVANVDSKTSK